MNDEEKKSQKVSMGKAFKLFWTNYVNFTGTSSRSEYWWWYLWNLIIVFVLGIPVWTVLPRLAHMVFNNDANQIGTIIAPLLIGLLLVGIYGLASLLPQITLLLRRIRDVGLPEPATITIVVANYALSLLGSLLPPLNFINIFLGIAIFVITLLPSNFKKNDK